MAPLVAALAAKGFSLLADAVLAKGKDVIEEKLGVSLDASVQSESGLLQLKQLEFDHQELLVQSAIESDRLYFEDTKSARDLSIKLSESDSFLNQNIMPILALGTVIIS